MLLRRFRPVDIVAVVLVVVAAGVAFMLFLQRADARDEERALNGEITKITSDLQAQKREQVRLEEQIRTRKAAQQPPEVGSFPPRLEAEALALVLTRYVAEAQRDLRVSAYESKRSSLAIAKTVHPAISYALELQGPKNSLLGALDLLNEYPTAVVERLDFARDAEDQTKWAMRLGVMVLHEAEQTGGP